MHFKKVLVPVKDFPAATRAPAAAAEWGAQDPEGGESAHSLIKKRGKNSPSWEKLLPRTFIFVKADYKFSSVQIYITYI